MHITRFKVCKLKTQIFQKAIHILSVVGSKEGAVSTLILI